MKPKGNNKLVSDIEIFVKNYKKRAITGNVIYANDDYRCYKRIRALADLYPYKNPLRTEKIDNLIGELWVLYYYYKININGRKVSYVTILIKYA